MIPGLIARGADRLLAQAPQATQQAQPPADTVEPAPPTPPPPAPVPLTERFRGLLGLAVIIAIGVASPATAARSPGASWPGDSRSRFSSRSSSCASRRAGALPQARRHRHHHPQLQLPGQPVRLRRARQAAHRSVGVVFAFQILPAIIFVSALFAIMYYLGVMQVIVRAFAVVMAKLMKTSGAESLDVAASIFMGQTEAPLTIRPFLPEPDPLRADDGDDRRHGAHLRLHHGGVHRLRRRCEASAHGRDHDRARHHHDGQDLRARGRPSRDLRQRQARHSADRREPRGRRRARHQRGPAPHAQRHRHAHLVRGAGGAGERHLRARARLAALDAREPRRSCSAGSAAPSPG